MNTTTHLNQPTCTPTTGESAQALPAEISDSRQRFRAGILIDSEHHREVARVCVAALAAGTPIGEVQEWVSAADLTSDDSFHFELGRSLAGAPAGPSLYHLAEFASRSTPEGEHSGSTAGRSTPTDVVLVVATRDDAEPAAVCFAGDPGVDPLRAVRAAIERWATDSGNEDLYVDSALHLLAEGGSDAVAALGAEGMAPFSGKVAVVVLNGGDEAEYAASMWDL